MRTVYGDRVKLFAATLPACAWFALAFVAVAHGSDTRGRDTTASASATVQTYCADLQDKISADTFQFSGWHCKQGPVMRGLPTILSWVTMTRADGRQNVELIWLVQMQPVEEAQVIDARGVPYYGYEPSYVKAAFRARTARLSA
jgi:hypothetical protein